MSKADADVSRRSGSAAKGSVVEKRVRGEDGRTTTVRVVDVQSKTLTSDLTYVFRRNVEKARRENRAVIGTADLAFAKR